MVHSSFIPISIIAVAVLSKITATSTETESDFIFSKCQVNKGGCRDCHISLVKSLLGSDGNVFNLSRAFFPPIIDPPDSVIVNYRFVNDTMDEIDTWFWATSGVYFLHPMIIFPFISLLFGKYRPIYEQVTTVTLNATECYGVSDEHMILLTQRLKVYIQEHTIYPEIEDDYVAMAVNRETFNQLLDTRSTINTAMALIVCPIFIFLILAFILIIMSILHCYRGTIKVSELNRHRKAAIVSSAIVSFNRLIYFIILDSIAIYFRGMITNNDYGTIHFQDQDCLSSLHSIIYNIPIVLLIFDMLLLIVSLACTVTSIAILCRDKLEGIRKLICDIAYYLSMSFSICFLLGILVHMPYIAMAYLSDPRHAASVLIYYIVITFVEFGLLEFTFRSTWFGKEQSETSNMSPASKLCTMSCVCAFGVAILFSVLVHALTVTATIFFYLIPVSESIGRAPSQIVVTYQTAFILVGGYIIYQVIFKKQNSLQRAIREYKQEWKSLPDHELLTKFYKDTITRADRYINLQIDKQKPQNKIKTIKISTKL